MEHCIESARLRPAALSGSQTFGSNSEAAQAPASRSSSFEAAVLTRLARRGQASLVAQTLWKAIHSPPAAHLTHLGHETDLGRSREEALASSENDAWSTVESKAMSERRASHAEASSLYGSHSATRTARSATAKQQGRTGIAFSLDQGPSVIQEVHSGRAEIDQSVAATEERCREGLRTTQQLLCQIADSQALEKILTALLLEAPVKDTVTVAQVCPSLVISPGLGNSDNGFTCPCMQDLPAIFGQWPDLGTACQVSLLGSGNAGPGAASQRLPLAEA